MRLTEKQKDEIGGIWQAMQEQVDGQGDTAAKAAKVMQGYCENLEEETALWACRRILEGTGKWNQIGQSLCMQQGPAFMDPAFAGNSMEAMLDEITGRMTRRQQKGFYLQSLDAFQKNKGSEEETMARAVLTQEELKRLLTGRIREFADAATVYMDKTAKEINILNANKTMTDNHKALRSASSLTQVDAFLFAAAAYTAAFNGILPQEFGEYPELLGVCAAAQLEIGLCSERYAKGPGAGAGLIAGVLCMVAAAALAYSAATAGAAADTVLSAMEAGRLGWVIGLFACVTLYMLPLAGCALLFGSVCAVLQAGSDSMQPKAGADTRQTGAEDVGARYYGYWQAEEKEGLPLLNQEVII